MHRCGAVTKTGGRCRNPASCYLHSRRGSSLGRKTRRTAARKTKISARATRGGHHARSYAVANADPMFGMEGVPDGPFMPANELLGDALIAMPEGMVAQPDAYNLQAVDDLPDAEDLAPYAGERYGGPGANFVPANEHDNGQARRRRRASPRRFVAKPIRARARTCF